MHENLVIVRGGGDIASGAIEKLHKCGFNVLVLEVENPSSIRRKVCYGEAVYTGEMEIEGIKSQKIKYLDEINRMFEKRIIPVYTDPSAECTQILNPVALVDGILAKKNYGTNRSMAPVTVALGPGFTAGKDVDVVIETMRGHNLGRLIFDGEAMKNTGVPGNIGGFTMERVIYSEYEGVIENIREIGDIVKKGDILAKIGDNEVYASIDGVLRGIIRNGYHVTKKFKIADIDPRKDEQKNCFTISDKSRSIGGAVLEAVISLMRQRGFHFF
jgi:xanthine dehydrogenase accessory factor